MEPEKNTRRIKKSDKHEEKTGLDMVNSEWIEPTGKEFRRKRRIDKLFDTIMQHRPCLRIEYDSWPKEYRKW